MRSVAIPVCTLLLLLPTVHFPSLLPGLVDGHRHARTTRLSDPDAVYRAVTLPRGLDLSDTTSSDVLKQLDRKLVGDKNSQSLYQTRRFSSTNWPDLDEASLSDGLPRREHRRNLAEERVVFSHSFPRQNGPVRRSQSGNVFQKTSAVNSRRKPARDNPSWNPGLVLSTVKNSWHSYNTHPTAKCNYSTLPRPRRSFNAYPYETDGLSDDTDPAVSDKTSSSVDPVVLKHRLQKIYRLFLTDDAIHATDILQDTLDKFAKRGDDEFTNDPQNALESPLSADNELNPTVYSQLAEEHSSGGALNHREAEIIAEEQPMDPYLIEYLETVRPSGSPVEDAHKDHRTTEAGWLDAQRRQSEDDSTEKEDEVRSMDDLVDLPGDISGVSSQGDVIMVHRRRKLSRAEQVRRLYDPSHLGPLARFSLSPKGRKGEGMAKKHPGTLHKHLAKAQPLKSVSESRPIPTPAPAEQLTDCRQEDASTMTCPSDDSVCLRDVMICDGVRDCRLGEDESPFLCMMRLWAFTLLNNVHSIFSAYVTPPSQDSTRHQSRAYRHDRSYRQSQPS